MTKTTMVLGLAFAASMVAASAAAGVLRDEVNKFSGVRTVEWRSLPQVEEAFAFTAAVGIPEGSSSRYYKAGLITYGDSRFADCNHTYWLLDGKRSPEIQTKYSSSSTGSTTLESFDLVDSSSMLRMIAAAKHVEFQVCGVEGEISQEDLEGIRQLLEQVEPA